MSLFIMLSMVLSLFQGLMFYTRETQASSGAKLGSYGSVLLSYPVSGGRRSMYFKLSDIMANSGSRPYTLYTKHTIITYRRA